MASPLYLSEGDVDVEDPSLSELHPLSSPSRLVLMQAYIDRARMEAGVRSDVKDILKNFKGFSPVERETLQIVYNSYVNTSPSKAQGELERAYGRLQKQARSDVERQAVELLAYHARMFRFRSRGSGYADLVPSCQLMGVESCFVVEAGAKIESVLSKKDIRVSDYIELQSSLDTFLFQKRFIPFFGYLASPLPELLGRMGLPLEAAILAAGMVKSQPDRQDLKKEVARYLTMAGDYRSALKYEEKASSGKTDLATTLKHLDWLILGGDYGGATELILKQTPDRLGSQKGRDVWVGLPRNGDVMRIRLAGLVFLEGDKKRAGQLLHDFVKKDTESKRAETLVARLRIAQMLLGSEPELAHKIAEDVTYIAQARGLEVIEYQATVLDGWALFFLNKNYNAMINFIKARGILTGKNRTLTPDFSREAGMYFLKRRMSQAVQTSAILSLSSYIAARRFDPADRFFLLWLPQNVDRHFLLDGFLRDLERTTDTQSVLTVLSRMSASQRFEFSPGSNPGGLRGLRTSIRESRFQNRFEWAPSPDPASFIREEAYDLHKMVLPAPHQGRHILFFAADPESDAGHFVLFEGRGGRWAFYVQTKGARDRIQDNCSFESGGNCQRAREFFTDFVDRSQGTLAVLYDPSLDLDYSRIFTGASVTYYGWPTSDKREKVQDYNLNASGPRLSDSCYDAGTSQLKLQSFLSEGLEGRLLLPARIEGSGQIYLRELECGSQSLRLWDLDRRFRSKVNLVLWDPTSQKDWMFRKELMRVFHDRGISVLEAFDDAEDLLTEDNIVPLVPGRYRVIFPAITFLED
ncbi:MAG: hypothetical protein KDK25_07005 [Leptospiraceae bacterium]|nr:hypothetical protein [Leptospiraceae bacterium]